MLLRDCLRLQLRESGAESVLDEMESGPLTPGRESSSSFSSGGKHFLHLQSPLKTYYLYADTQSVLNRWLDALALPWLGFVESPRPRGDSDGSAGGGSDVQTREQRAASRDSAEATGGASGGGGSTGDGGGGSGDSRSYSRDTSRGRLDTRVSLSSRHLDA